MTDQFRELCAELLENLEDEWIGDRRAEPEIVIRARTALAQPEPAGDVSDEDVGVDLDKVFYQHAQRQDENFQPLMDVQSFSEACAALLLLSRRAPVPPTEGEVAELVKWLHGEAEADEEYDHTHWLCAADLRRIATLLQHHQPPQPVAVSERPWERDGWCDEQGRCWLRGKVEGDWRLLHPTNSGVPQLKYCFSHSLPFYALPIPRSEND